MLVKESAFSVALNGLFILVCCLSPLSPTISDDPQALGDPEISHSEDVAISTAITPPSLTTEVI